MNEILSVLSGKTLDIGAILFLFILLLATNRLYTKRQHDEIVNIYKDVADRALAANEKMLTNDDITHALLRSILRKAEEKGSER